MIYGKGISKHKTLWLFCINCLVYLWPCESKHMYLLYLKLKNTNGFTPQHCLEDKLDILFQFFFFVSLD